MSHYKVIIIGSGPAGLTAALYAARSNLSPLVFEGQQPGGQLTITTGVENYPGFPEGIMGPDLMDAIRKQAQRFGAETLFKSVESVDLSRRPFKLVADGEEYFTKSIIIATGASAKLLNLPSETEYMGYGVSACATCDGFFFKNQHVAVVGGGDTAMEEASYLTKHAARVTIIHRRNELRASKVMQERVKKNPKIDFIWDSVVEEVLGTTENGNKKFTGLRLKNVKTGGFSEFKCDGLFLAIGHQPNTNLFQGRWRWMLLDISRQSHIALRRVFPVSLLRVMSLILHIDKRSALPAQDVWLPLMSRGSWQNMSKK